MLSADALTSQQQAVVRHGQGPALVLAVPGAGKTTALVHRIRALVAERNVDPERILACSFNRDTVSDLSDALAALDVYGVDVRTLHSLGHRLLPQNQSPNAPESSSPSTIAHRLARRALQDVADEQGVAPDALGITASDLVDRVAAWKQQLAYADLEAASLPAPAHDTARQADPDNEDVLRLYERFEAHRCRENLRTYPDMLRDGWERLMRDDDLRTQAQSAYTYVLVDEFQDVSRAQFEILNSLTSEHRNLMVVGDDDQCIYRWRGARPAFLLNFADRYDAESYRMTASFRLPAAPLVLANTAITHNDDRHPKQIELTQGVQGTAECLCAADVARAADQVARTAAARSRTADYSLSDMVVLVRTYGQTPPLERALIDRDLPYRIRGRPPFYRRPPVQTLLRYLYWAVLERRRRRQGGFTDPAAARQYTARFAQIANHPNRHIHREWIDVVTREALDRGASVIDCAANRLSDLARLPRANAEAFLKAATALVDRLGDSADTVLRDLTSALDYEDALRAQSVHDERGEAKVRTVRALQRYAGRFDSAPGLLRGIKALADARTGHAEHQPVLNLQSIHRAKGAEWPIVFVPGCVEGTLPHTPGTGSTDELEEERRLFYVALTRAQEHLYLSHHEDAERSRFLDDADVDTRLPLSRAVRHGLTADPASLSDAEAIRLCRGLVALDLSDYIRTRWSPSPSRADALSKRLARLASPLEKAKRRVAKYQDAQKTYKENIAALRQDVDQRIEELRDTLGTAPLTAIHEAPIDTYYADDARFTFQWIDDNTRIAVHWQDARIGTLNPLGTGRLNADTLLSLPWASLIGRFAGMAQGRQRLRITIDWPDTRAHLFRDRREALSPPDPPTEVDQMLADNAFQDGYACLQDRLSALTASSQ